MNHENKKISIDLYGDGVGKVELVESYGTDLSVVNAARVSFGNNKEKLDDKDIRLINYLVSHKHTSTLEHCGLTCKFTVPLFVRSQHHRHRTWSYNEISRRYTDIDIKFYEPKKYRTQHASNRQASNIDDLIDPKVHGIDGQRASELVRGHHEISLAIYDALIKEGVCREQARGVLPQNLYTQYYGTVNLNNLMKFITLRTHNGAQWEIQRVGEALLGISEDLWPISVKAFKNHIINGVRFKESEFSALADKFLNSVNLDNEEEVSKIIEDYGFYSLKDFNSFINKIN